MKGYLETWLGQLRPGYVLTDTDMATVKRVMLALAKGKVHHHQARGA